MDSFKISKEQYFDLMKLDRTNAVNLFLYLLASADDNGALIVSIRKISSELDIGLRTVRTVLKKLYAANMVTHQVTHKGSIVTINNIDSYKALKLAGDTPSDTQNEALETRKHAFGEKLVPYIEQYGKALIREFFDYWTEHNENGRKMRFEKEKTFEISRRLTRWSKNNNNNKSSKSSLPVGMNLQNSNNSERYKLDDRWNK